MERYVALFDIHWGYERDASRHKVPLHDVRACNVALAFIKDFKPHHVLLGGDILDCGAISHHRKGIVGQLEGLRLLAEAQECRERIIEPIAGLTPGRLIYHIGNHEDWLQDVTDELPALEGIVDIRALLQLGKKWEVIPQGGISRLGKLVFAHGDQLRGGEHVAKAAVTAYEKSIRFGHFHTYQTYTKVAPVDTAGHTGIAVPCLCKKGHRYGQGAPNRWAQGFLYGYLHPDGSFNDYVALIINGKATINGKHYV